MKKVIFTLFWCLSSYLMVFSQTTGNLRGKHFNIEKSSLGIQGYDPVSYFSGKPKEGKKEFAITYEGIVYRFISQSNMELFKANPSKYEPAYGGWCAYAMGKNGEKVEIDPETYKITDGKLYLFYNKFFTNTLPDWNKSEAMLKKQADENWNKIYK